MVNYNLKCRLNLEQNYLILICFFNLNNSVMSHEKSKEQVNRKKEPAKSLKEKRQAKKVKKEEKKRF